MFLLLSFFFCLFSPLSPQETLLVFLHVCQMGWLVWIWIVKSCQQEHWECILSFFLFVLFSMVPLCHFFPFVFLHFCQMGWLVWIWLVKSCQQQHFNCLHNLDFKFNQTVIQQKSLELDLPPFLIWILSSIFLSLKVCSSKRVLTGNFTHFSI